MYLGIQERRFNIYIGKPGFGWRYAKRHIYVCEHCGREAAIHVDFPAEEPFFCDCNRLIGIEPETAAAS